MTETLFLLYRILLIKANIGVGGRNQAPQTFSLRQSLIRAISSEFVGFAP